MTMILRCCSNTKACINELIITTGVMVCKYQDGKKREDETKVTVS